MKNFTQKLFLITTLSLCGMTSTPALGLTESHVKTPASILEIEAALTPAEIKNATHLAERIIKAYKAAIDSPDKHIHLCAHQNPAVSTLARLYAMKEIKPISNFSIISVSYSQLKGN